MNLFLVRDLFCLVLVLDFSVEYFSLLDMWDFWVVGLNVRIVNEVWEVSC